MNFFVSKPEVPSEVSEAIFIVIPCAMKADGGIQSPLENNPTPAVYLQVTVHLKICSSVWVDRINTTDVVAGIEDIIAPSRFMKQKLSQSKSSLESEA